MDVERWLLPDQVRELSVHPALTFARKCDVEVPHHACENQAHFRIGKAVNGGQHGANYPFGLSTGCGSRDLLHSNAVSRTVREGFEAVSAVVAEWRVLVVCGCQPSLGQKLSSSMEMVGGEVCCSVRNSEDRLRRLHDVSLVHRCHASPVVCGT